MKCATPNLTYRRRQFVYLWWITYGVFLLVPPCLQAADAPDFQPAGGTSLDRLAFTQWLGGEESPIAEDAAKGGPGAVVWTVQTRPDWPGVKFGAGRANGVRHLRIGFTQNIAVGSVLVRGGGTLSVLKPDTAYPGDVANDAQWLAADRLVGGEVSRQKSEMKTMRCGFYRQARRRERCVLATRPHRATAKRQAGWAASGSMSSDSVTSHRKPWCNPWRVTMSAQSWSMNPTIVPGYPGTTARKEPPCPYQPNIRRSSRSLGRGRSRSAVSACCGPAFPPSKSTLSRAVADGNVHEAAGSNWRQVTSRSDMDALYPMALGPNWLPFAERSRHAGCVCGLSRAAEADHPHLLDKVKEGRRVWLGELMAVAPLVSDAALASLVLPKITTSRHRSRSSSRCRKPAW